MKRCVFLALLLSAALVAVPAFVLVGCENLTSTGVTGTTLSLTTTSSLSSTPVSGEMDGSTTTLTGSPATSPTDGTPATSHPSGSPAAATTTTAASVALTEPPLELKATLYEETDFHLAWEGDWGQGVSDILFSGGSVRTAGTAGATVTVAFTGTRITWMGCMGHDFGIATVYLDGHAQTVDLYGDGGTHYREKIWSSAVLAYGSHKVRIECTGTARPGSSTGSTEISVDAFDITGTIN